MNPEDRPDDLVRLDELVEPPPRSLRMRIGVGAGIVLLIAALVVAVLVSMLAPKGNSQFVASGTKAAQSSDSGQSSPASGSTSFEAAPGSETSGDVFVHVLGAVAKPGLFELHAGSRLIDAVSAAGGFAADADQGGVNLARLVADGEQIVVPRVGETPDAAGTAGSAAEAGTKPAGTKVSLNSGTAADFATLPRIGPAMAQRIVDWRNSNGRFATLQDLLNVSGIGEKTFDSLKDFITL